MPSPLSERDEDEKRKPEDGTIERPSGRGDRRVQIEGAGERDAGRAEERRETWPLREPVEDAENPAQVPAT